jgi:hypothetical protein
MSEEYLVPKFFHWPDESFDSHSGLLIILMLLDSDAGINIVMPFFSS